MVINWDVFMPNLSRNDWEESVFCLFSENSTFIHSIFKPDDEMLNETRQLKRLKYINGQLFGLTIFLYHDKKYYDLKQQKNT